jgi:hypothetical protein
MVLSFSMPGGIRHQSFQFLFIVRIPRIIPAPPPGLYFGPVLFTSGTLALLACGDLSASVCVLTRPISMNRPATTCNESKNGSC